MQKKEGKEGKEEAGGTLRPNTRRPARLRLRLRPRRRPDGVDGGQGGVVSGTPSPCYPGTWLSLSHIRMLSSQGN